MIARIHSPAELDRLTYAGFERQDLIGLHYNPVIMPLFIGANVDANYMMVAHKPV